jgi:hypothetical protein
MGSKPNRPPDNKDIIMGTCPICGKPYYATLGKSKKHMLYIHKIWTNSGGLYIEWMEGCDTKATRE